MINELISKKEVFDFDKLDRFLRYTNKSESFVDFVERRIEERGDITESTKASHRTFATSLREFDRIIYFSDLTKANITLYDDWLHAKGYSQPTIYNYHKRNKRYIHEAIKFDLLKNDPYKGERFSRGKHAIRKYLTAEELKKVKDAQIDSKRSVESVTFLFFRHILEYPMLILLNSISNVTYKNAAISMLYWIFV